MKIFVLVICCLYTLKMVMTSVKEITIGTITAPKAVAGMIVIAAGVLAIIFQSMSL